LQAVADNRGFTHFLIALAHSRDLLETFHSNPEEAFSGWNLTPEQREILRRGNMEEIQAEVRREHPDAVAAWWVMLESWVMSPDWVMGPDEPEPPEGY
jgi:hypothetical protein